nr:outer capsid protein VP4 [Porcine rotavirus B]
MMISYLRREWQSYGETVTTVVSLDDDDYEEENGKQKKEKAIKAGNKYCYSNKFEPQIYENDLKGFSLGNDDTHIDTIQLNLYSGKVENGYMFFSTNPPCNTIIEVKINVDGKAYITETELTSFSCQIVSVTRTNNKSDIKYHATSELTPGQKTFLTRSMTTNGCYGLNINAKIDAELKVVTITSGPSYTTSTGAETFLWDETCAEDVHSKMRIGETVTPNSRIIIYEQQDGFWKIITETIWIKLEAVFVPYGTMGGAFKNWLVDSGFEKKEHTYTYQRDGQTVTATTVIYPKPTGMAGVNQPWRPATDFNGQYTCLQPGDTFAIWYFEDAWQIKNAIYAKNFQTDTKAEGTLENKGELKFRMNYIPSLAKIKNKKGKVKYQYLDGGFAQIDATNYTGMALVFNFICTGEKFVTTDYNQKQDPAKDPYICFIGKHYLQAGNFYEKGCCVGFAAGYDDITISHDMTISYSVMKPSDPDFVTGGENYGQSITSSLEISIRDLQDQINSIKAELNISQVTSAVFSAVTSIGDLPNLFSNITQVFSKIKTSLSKLKQRKMKPKPVKATMMIDKHSVDVPSVHIMNKMPEEMEMGIIYNSIRRGESHNMPAFAISSEIELPYIQTTSTLTPKFKKYLSDRGLISADDIVIQFDPLDISFSTLRKKNAEILKYKIDPEVAHEVLSQMSTSSTRSLFSLNVRKQISTNNSFATPTYDQLISRILDDKEILDILGKLNPSSVTDLFQEFLDRIQDLLSSY